MTRKPARTASPDIERPKLVARALGAAAYIVLIEASAGMGKSRLLEAIARHGGAPVRRGPRPPAPAALALWDIPPGVEPQPLPEAFVAGGGRLILAKRPETPLPGLDRALAYGRVLRLDETALRFTAAELRPRLGAAQAREIVARTGGWPALVAAGPGGEAEAARYCLAESLRGESEAQLVAREAAGPPPAPYADIAAAALTEELARRRADPAAARRLAEAYRARGLAPQAIQALQAAGLEEEALEAFAAAGGWCYTFYFGPQAFDAALAGFAQTARRSEALTFALSFQALKRGDGPRARKLFAERFGPVSQDPARVFAPGSGLSPAARCFYFVMTLYEEPIPSDELMQAALATLEEVPSEAHLPRGNVYNAGLEFFVRESRFAEAEDFALRALFHYERAGVRLLSFYICVHRAVIELHRGDLAAARAHCEAAREKLAHVPFDSPGDGRILALLDACVQYEGGRAEALMTFLVHELDHFAHGETWPSLLEIAVHYGAQALSEHYSTRAALAFVDRWRLRHLRSLTLREAIELRTILVLQNANRWDEAEAALGADAIRLSRDRLMSGMVDLARLREGPSLRAALVWMRQIAFRSPRAPGLERRLAALADNLRLTPRQRVAVEIWLAYVQRMNRDAGGARTRLRGVLEGATQSGSLAPLAEERPFLDELLGQRQILAHAETSPQARQALRRLQDIGFSTGSAAARLGLTRQETRLLLIVCRGATNKDAAKALRLSEATVKFHLGNAYRKLGCARRSEAAAAALALGLAR
jgi:DNA-binding CsgD family transcriptional regulator